MLKLGGLPVSNNDQSNSLVIESSLQCYFYDQLRSINEKSRDPLPNEAIYYSSLVMDKFGESGKFFETKEGKVREKILGTKLLQTSSMTKGERKRALKDIGDTALLICGYFSDSLNKKIIDTGYYQELGQTAYRKLNSVVPQAYDVPSFFKGLSFDFERLTMVMNLVSEKTLNHDWPSDSVYLFVSKKVAG